MFLRSSETEGFILSSCFSNEMNRFLLIFETSLGPTKKCFIENYQIHEFAASPSEQRANGFVNVQGSVLQ